MIQKGQTFHKNPRAEIYSITENYAYNFACCQTHEIMQAQLCSHVLGAGAVCVWGGELCVWSSLVEKQRILGCVNRVQNLHCTSEKTYY